MTNLIERPYRKNLAEHGLIYMGGMEHKVLIKNLSLTGLLVELYGHSKSLEISDIYHAIAATPVLDFYLPKLRIAGEVDVARVDIEGLQILIALTFRVVCHDVDNLLYKRQAYRKMMNAPGKILLDGDFIEFETLNVSVEGLMVRINRAVDLNVETITTFQFKRLDLEGAAKVIWIENEKASTLMGLQYVHMEKTHIEGIPTFIRR